MSQNQIWSRRGIIALMTLEISQLHRPSGIAAAPHSSVFLSTTFAPVFLSARVAHVFLSATVALVTALTFTTTRCFADSQQLVNEGVAQYKAGHLDKAVPLLVQALKEDGSNGPAHYYLGRALKQMGQDDQALKQLDMAAKFCPPAVLQSLAAQAIADHAKNGQNVQQKPESGPFGMPSFASISSGFMGLFQTITHPDPQERTLQLVLNPYHLRGLILSCLCARASRASVVGLKNPSRRFARSNSQVAETISMGKMVSLVNEGTNSKWRSNPSGRDRIQSSA